MNSTLRHCTYQVLTGVILLSACGGPSSPNYGGGGGPMPDWVNGGQSVQFPDAQYLIGVGRGETPQACENDGYAAISKIFHAHIEQVSRDWQGHFSQVNASGKIQVEAMEISQITQVSTDYVLKGAKIGERWGTNCLAVLERFPAARTVQDEIDRIDVEIGSTMEAGDKAASPSQSFFAYKKAMLLLQKRDALNAELRILAPNMGKAPIIGWAQVVAKFTGAKSQIKIGLKLEGRNANTIQTCLAEELAKKEIQVQENSSDVDMWIHGELKFQDAGWVINARQVKATMNLRITDVTDGKTLAAFTEFQEAGRPSLREAEQTSVTKLCIKLVPNLVSKIQSSMGR